MMSVEDADHANRAHAHTGDVSKCQTSFSAVKQCAFIISTALWVPVGVSSCSPGWGDGLQGSPSGWDPNSVLCSNAYI